jgi:putative transposase
MLQVARNLLDIVDGFLNGKRFLLLDRDPLYTCQFRALLSSVGVTPIRLPASSPNLNAYAERFVRSIKDECLNKLVLLGENHLRAAICEYLEHYHEERNHQGLGGQLIVPPANLNRPGPIVCGERLGGLLRFYRPRGGLKRSDRVFAHYAGRSFPRSARGGLLHGHRRLSCKISAIEFPHITRDI